MSAQHTPGPWEWDRSVGVLAGDRLVALVYSTACCDGETNLGDNARLIAAAPDMLELLQRFERFAAGTGFVYPLGSLQELRQIIAKATGGAS